MVTQVPAFRTVDGKVFPDEAAAIKHELFLIIKCPEGGAQSLPAVIDQLIEDDARVVGLLQRHRRLVPAGKNDT